MHVHFLSWPPSAPVLAGLRRGEGWRTNLGECRVPPNSTRKYAGTYGMARTSPFVGAQHATSSGHAGGMNLGDGVELGPDGLLHTAAGSAGSRLRVRYVGHGIGRPAMAAASGQQRGVANKADGTPPRRHTQAHLTWSWTTTEPDLCSPPAGDLERGRSDEPFRPGPCCVCWFTWADAWLHASEKSAESCEHASHRPQAPPASCSHVPSAPELIASYAQRSHHPTRARVAQAGTQRCGDFCDVERRLRVQHFFE